jgi:protein TonB
VKKPETKAARARHGGIADVVFSGETGGRGLRLAGSLAVILALYGAAIALSEALGAPVANWSAEMAARIHDAIARDRAVDLTPPPPAPPPPTPPPTPAPAPAAIRTAIKTAGPPRPAPAEPARAGKLTAVANDPVDFTGAAFVVGGAATFPGGTTAARGTGTAPGSSGPPAGSSPPGAGGHARAPSRARAVSLDQAAWSCPWPAEADAEQVNERTVVLRATVRADGRAETVDLLSDPGFGFGPAARACALTTRFEPARNADGQPIAAQSAPIRVHFFR